MNKLALKLIIVFFLLSLSGPVMAWHDKTHMSVAKAAGYEMWYNAAGADMAKIKAGNKEKYNHWYNNTWKKEITAQLVLKQAERYNKDSFTDIEGHLLGAIIGALREYKKDLADDKYSEYHLAYCAHYIGDLSMPFHNIPFDDFNRSHHSVNDGIVEKTILNEPQKITRHMYKIILRNDQFEADLAREIARIANISRNLGYKLAAEQRDMTPEEAYGQLGHSASLLAAVLRHFQKI